MNYIRQQAKSQFLKLMWQKPKKMDKHEDLGNSDKDQIMMEHPHISTCQHVAALAKWQGPPQ